MCQHHQHKKEKYAYEKKYRLADFFRMWWSEYCKHPTKYIKPEQYKAVNAMLVCQTEALGIDYYVCPQCGEISIVWHSCKNRFCANCSWKDTVKWASKLKLKMFNIPHRHSVFTLPHKLNGLIAKNKKALLNIMTRISADIFKSWFKSKHNVKIGIVGVIHTWGEKKNVHNHFHMLVSWGGTDFKTGKLVVFNGKEKEYINYNHLKKEFRRKFVNELDKLFKSGDLKHNFKKPRTEFKKLKKKLHDTQWQIHLEEPMDTPAAVIRYIARYSKRACLSDYKITNIEGEFITFKYKDYRDRIDPKDKKSPAKVKELRLHYSKFFPLLLQHVPEPYFRMVRYYGAYARFGDIPEEYRAIDDEQLLEEIEAEYATSENNPQYCVACKQEKIYIHSLIDTRYRFERTEPFDIEKHKHHIYQKVDIKKDEKNLKKAA